MDLTPDDIKKIRKKEVANAIAKLQGGKTLTKRESTLIAQSATGIEAEASGYVSNWGDLAEACGVDRRTITNVRQRYGKDCPRDRDDGRKEVAAWIEFLEEKDVRGRGVNNPDELDEHSLKLEERRLAVELGRFKLEKARDAVLPVVEFEAALATMLGQFRASLNALPSRAAGKIVQRARAALLAMLRSQLPPKTWERVEKLLAVVPVDYADVEEELEGEVELVLRTLERCDYLEEPPPEED